MVFKRSTQSKFFPMSGMVKEISGRISFQNFDHYEISDFVFGEKICICPAGA